MNEKCDIITFHDYCKTKINMTSPGFWKMSLVSFGQRRADVSLELKLEKFFDLGQTAQVSRHWYG